MVKTRVAFVCQRYGVKVNGGAELYCRQVAERLTSEYDVHVYTTCAMDYITWANEYKDGTELINGVTVHRFRSICERNLQRFGEISGKVLGTWQHSDQEELEWLQEQGPVCPALLDELEQHRHEYKAIFFMTYLYYLTAMGMLRHFENMVLIPTVHDEPPVYLRHYEKVFSAAKAFVWNTHEERSFAYRRFPGIEAIPGDIVALGIEKPKGTLPGLPQNLKGLQYIVYAGRIDEIKGCGEMFQYFQRYKELSGSDLKLVLIGKPVMEIPNDPDIISLGFVSEEMKFTVIGSALALVLFSHFESLSMVVLESMLMGRPVLVTGKCEVLKGHCIRSNAGLYFNSFDEFAYELRYLRGHRHEAEVMGENGKHYVYDNYRWSVVVGKYRRLIEGLSTASVGGAD